MTRFPPVKRVSSMRNGIIYFCSVNAALSSPLTHSDVDDDSENMIMNTLQLIIAASIISEYSDPEGISRGAIQHLILCCSNV